ncbi:hypothetical protein [[Leptolyngbya] sp. PCC 7376]|uniref:hypothetical protein n=1 Tax=[Leptolyngbya] sp. PCC 7376 TaxID=111781 RepID=UPI00059F2130|nr:hypothetical protein [[Leptolyngbya] sp. PCC 7376]
MSKKSKSQHNIGAVIAPSLLEKIIPAPGEGTSEEVQENGCYDLRFWGETASGKTLTIKVTGDRGPGYGSTAQILAQAGLCLANQTEKLGGFRTPSSIFGDRLINRLTQFSGLTFDIIQVNDGSEMKLLRVSSR